MKVGIVGAGAMGSLYGGMLAGAGHDVWLIDIAHETVDAINAEGLRMSCGDQSRVVHPRATTDAADAGVVDLAMFWCKGTATAAAVEAAAPLLGDATIAATLQNGLGNAELIARVVPAERIVHGVTETGAMAKRPGHIELTPATWAGTGAGTWVGTADPAHLDRAHWVAELLRGAGIAAETRADVDALIWGKLAVNCPMAPIVALARLPIGTVAASPDMEALLGGLCDEVVAVANASGIPLEREATREHAFAVWRSVGDHVSSMGLDVLGRRPTEIESISGEIVRRGASLGVPTPLNDTLARLVRLVESHYDGQLGVR